MIIIIVGKSCSGKTSAREHLESKGMISFEASKYMKEYINKYNLNPKELFIKFGKDFVSKLIFQEIKKSEGSKSFVISGLRTVEEIEFLKNKSKVKIIGLNVSDEICFQRNLEKNREDVIKEFSDFYSKRIDFNSKLGLDKIFQNYIDFWIDNNGDINNLKSKLDEFIEKNETT
jgi:dephospho-CoA kinase